VTTKSVTPPPPMGLRTGEFEIAGQHVNIYHRKTTLDDIMAIVFLIIMITLIVMAFLVVLWLINTVK